MHRASSTQISTILQLYKVIHLVSYKNDGLLIYTSTLAVITITTIFATLAISKSAKLLDYSSVLSTFSTLFLCLITNSLKDPGYHGCLCRMHTYVCNVSCNGSPCCHMADVYFDNQIIAGLEVLQGGHTLCQHLAICDRNCQNPAQSRKN